MLSRGGTGIKTGEQGRTSFGRLTVLLACVALGMLLDPVSAAASPYVHAHRGGSLATAKGQQQPAFGEATMPAFRRAAKRGFVLELDVKLSADRVPLVIHDARLDRTTICDGLVADRTAAEIRRRCRVDILGTAGNVKTVPRRRGEKVPTLRQVLRLAQRRGVEVNAEVKNVPTDPDFDTSDSYVRAVAREIRRSGFPPSRLIVQSFWPPNLDAIEADPYFELAETSLLTLPEMNEGGPGYADVQGYDWFSPAWPVSRSLVEEAHSLGLRVVPYTLNEPEQIKEAARIGIDAVISDDPGISRRAVAAVSPKPSPIPPPPTRAQCAVTHADRHARPIKAFEPAARAPRIFAIQFKQELRHVTTYESFRTKIECLIRRYVVPKLADDRPNVVALTEDVGLMTLATGSRGAAARRIFEDPSSAPSCEAEGAPCGVAAAIAAVRTGYSKEATVYQQRFQDMGPVAATFVAGTDTFARGWMQVFSDMADRYGVYILGSNNQPAFRESVDEADIDAFADPDLPRPESVYVATDGSVYNEVFMWGPHDVRKEGPSPLRNVVTQNKKVPITEIEEAIQVSNGPEGGPDAIENMRPYRLPGTRARISFATSKPAFVYNGTATHGFGEALAPGIDPCADVRSHYMRCLDALGTNIVMQDEANPGRWAGPAAEGYQSLVWLSSTWRAVADPTVEFDYNVTPHMVGNLADLPFDGQTAITQRGLRGKRSQRHPRRCTYVGATRFLPDPPESDAEYLHVYAGRKREFLGLAPWVTADRPRDELRETSAKLAPGSGDPLENDYLETAIVADLPFPPQPVRASCKGATKRR